jgi:hypothetical protein
MWFDKLTTNGIILLCVSSRLYEETHPEQLKPLILYGVFRYKTVDLACNLAYFPLT